MNCNIYREQIIEDFSSISPEAKIHIQNCFKCKRLYNEYSKFEKIISDAKKNLKPNLNTSLTPQYVVNLAFLKKSIQNNLASLKRMYIYATVILMIFIYAFLFNIFQDWEPKEIHKNITTQNVVEIDDFYFTDKELELLDKLTTIDDRDIDKDIASLFSF
ncbi:MAG: hypothetical protein ACK4NF_02780 [Planctomycetota bacterium]